jgi:uncharacterized protein
MRIIAVEEHMFPRAVPEAAGALLPARVDSVAAQLDDVGEARLRMMDEAGIDVQVLSMASGSVIQGLDPDAGCRFSRMLNDALARSVAAHPSRFAAFASLPMTAPVRAADELRRAVQELGHVGAMIHGHTNGVFLDSPTVRPVLAAAEQLGVPIYLHPTFPPPAVGMAYGNGLPPDVASALTTSAWGWHAECGMHVLRLVVGGVFERFPGLQIIVGHMGENLPFSLARADYVLGPLLDGSPGVAETVLRHVHVATSGYTTDPPLLCALAVFGADRILFAVDHPFSPSAPATNALRQAPLNQRDRDKIAHGNAERLLGL